MAKRTVLITGSTSGIGKSIAFAFAQKGYNLVFNGLEKDGAEIATGIATLHHIEHVFSTADIRNPEAIREMVQMSAARFSVIDVLVNNAGIQHVAPLESFPEEKWDQIISTNLTAAFHLTKAVWPGMKKQGFGRIINIASVHSLVASEYKSAYVAAKHGLIGLTKTAALEGAGHGITSNAVCPGYVKTPLVENQIADQAVVHQLPEEEVVRKVMLAKQPVKEFIDAKTIAALCLFLASEQAGTLTGSAIPIDGGWSAQ